MTDSSTATTKMPLWLLASCAALAVVPPVWMVVEWQGSEQRLAWLAWLLCWCMPVVCVFAVGCFVWRVRAREASWQRAWADAWPGLLLAVVATIVVFWISPPQMRVQFDETSIVGVSQNLHHQGLAVLTTGAVPSQGAIVPMENMVDKRPTLFAYLVSWVHAISGYRVANAFFVNGLLLVLGLFALYAGVRSRMSVHAALSAPLLVLAVPLTTVVATSAGFELLATVLLLCASLAALAFAAKPSHGRLAAFVGTAMLLAHARYESVLAVGLLALFVAVAAWRRYRPGRGMWLLLSVCPALVTPLFFLLEHAQNPNFTPEAGGQDLASFAHFAAHVGPFLSHWFGSGVGSALPGWLAVVALVLWLWRIAKKRGSRVDVLAAVPIALTLVVLAWFYGDVREQTALRLFLPLAWVSLLPLLAVPLLREGHSRRAGVTMVVACTAICALRLPFVADGTAFPRLPIASLTTELDRLVERLPGDRKSTLWVGAPAQHLIVKGHAALSARSFARMGQNITQLQRQGDVDRIYLLATPLDSDMAPALGSVQELRQRVPTHVVERVGGAMPITVYQVGR